MQVRESFTVTLRHSGTASCEVPSGTCKSSLRSNGADSIEKLL